MLTVILMRDTEGRAAAPRLWRIDLNGSFGHRKVNKRRMQKAHGVSFLIMTRYLRSEPFPFMAGFLTLT